MVTRTARYGLPPLLLGQKPVYLVHKVERVPLPVTKTFYKTTKQRNNETTMENEIKANAMTATIWLHGEMLDNDAFAGYEGDINAFNELYKQVYAIARYELFDGAEVDQIIETFLLYLEEIANGERDQDWYLYV